MNYPEMIIKSVNESLQNLGWGCTGCHWIRQCEAEAGNPGSRYCWPIIEAAILCKKDFQRPTVKP
jgi:hypothetical protein